MSSRNSEKLKTAALQLPAWIEYWVVVASILVGFDCIYVVGTYHNFKQLIPGVILSLWTWYGESDTQYSEQGVKDGNGWIMSQSLFNIFELAAQIAFLVVLRRNSVHRLLTILISSVCTLWKTLLYMSIIAYSADPVKVVPLLACWPMNYSPKEENRLKVEADLAKDSCSAQFFKFQFNFWWIVMPFCVIVVCCGKITSVFNALSGSDNALDSKIGSQMPEQDTSQATDGSGKPALQKKNA
jgi:hypothetical protein